MPSRARVETFEIVTATTPESAEPPETPPRASVVAGAVESAVRSRLAAPVSCDPSESSAVVASLTTLSATDAPMPVVPETPLPGRARAAVSLRERPVKLALVAGAMTVTPGSIAARVWNPAMLTASAPAAPTMAAPPAPDVDSAW